jgi:nitroimidazol reductase NimA-like FMN-containing flavoprotein (pyridoxamine 5'-phosphate oxidase superfamily)
MQRELNTYEIEELLREQRIVRVGFDAEDQRYLLPLGYIWLDNSLNLILTKGRKTEMLAINPHVSFQLDNSAEKSLLNWSSVTGEGTIEVIKESVTKARVLELMLDRFPELKVWGEEEYKEKERRGEVVLARIRPRVITGRGFVVKSLSKS